MFDTPAPVAASAPACSQLAPCSLQIATESASANDEVIVAPGTYVETNVIGATANGVNIHGAPGVSKPTIQSSSGGVILSGTGQRIADLRIEHSDFGGALSIYNDAIAERMVVETTNGTAACSPYFGSVLRDSVCIAKGVGGAGVGVSITDAETTGILRNVTAVATGDSGAAIAASAGLVIELSANVTLDVRNTIALAGPLATADVVLSTTGGATADIDLRHSNYDTVDSTGATTFDPVGSPTNQTAAPQLTSAYRQLATSPTRNAGSADSFSGSLDADGAQRVQGTAIDIGSYESDGIPPDTSLTSAPPARTSDATPGFTWSDTEPAFESANCTMDGAAVSCTAGAYTSPLLADGPHTFAVAAVDDFLNPDQTPASAAFTVDTTRPRTTIDKGPKRKTRSRKARFAFSSDEPGSTFRCKLDKGSASPCTSALKVKRLKKGRHTFTVVATDLAGNVEASPATYKWKVKKRKRK